MCIVRRRSSKQERDEQHVIRKQQWGHRVCTELGQLGQGREDGALHMLKVIHEDLKQQRAERAALLHPNDALKGAGQALSSFHADRHISIQRLQGSQLVAPIACSLQRCR
jgi:hypothetical protein